MKPDDQADLPLAQEQPGSIGHTSTSRGMSPKPRTATEIQDWFVNAISGITNTQPEDIDLTVPFESFGLDSVAAVGLTGELEDWLGCEVDPTAVYDYPTIEALSNHFAEQSTKLGPSS